MLYILGPEIRKQLLTVATLKV